MDDIGELTKLFDLLNGGPQRRPGRMWMFKQPLALSTNARGNEVDQGVRVPDQCAEDSDRHIGVERDVEREVHAAARELG